MPKWRSPRRARSTWIRTRLLPGFAVLMLAPVGATADDEPPDRPHTAVGQRVRITHSVKPVPRSDGSRPADRAVVVGTLRADDGQRVAITVKGLDDPVVVPRGAIQRFQVSRGRRSMAREGAVLGGALGGLLGIVFGAACYATCFDDDEGLGARGLAGATALLGGIGAGFGAVVGAPFRTDRWEDVSRAPATPAGAGDDRERFRLAAFGGLGAHRFAKVFPSFRNPLAPAATLGLLVGMKQGPEMSLRIEWVPTRTFRENPFEGGTSRTEMGLASGLAGLHWNVGRRVQPALLVGLSRQMAVDSLDHPVRGHTFRDPTWCVTLGGDLDVKVAGPIRIVPQFRLDTDGGRITSGMQVRAGVGVKAVF